MKKMTFLLVCLCGLQTAQAQLMKKLGDKVKQTVDRTTDKILGDDKTKNPADPAADSKGGPAATQAAGDNLGKYNAYDFVPGDSILFFDDLLNEASNEIPSKWILDKGRAEIFDADGETVMSTRGGTLLRPRMKPATNYLPSRFTIEFDVKHVNFTAGYGRALVIKLANPSADTNPDAGIYGERGIEVWASGEAEFGNAEGKWPYPPFDPGTVATMKQWKHVAISVNEKSLKVYVNQYRILNAQIEFGKPSSISFSVDNDYEAPVLIKNFRVLAGGKSPAKQVTTTKTYIARGILFERASATLLPESMGEINNLVKLMQTDPSLGFEIGGHTSTEAGSNAEANQKLSEERAETVRKQMIAMGIAESRLSAKGYGQNKPIATNDTPEGRATNRRVEFVKK